MVTMAKWVIGFHVFFGRGYFLYRCCLLYIQVLKAVSFDLLRADKSPAGTALRWSAKWKNKWKKYFQTNPIAHILAMMSFGASLGATVYFIIITEKGCSVSSPPLSKINQEQLYIYIYISSSGTINIVCNIWTWTGWWPLGNFPI